MFIFLHTYITECRICRFIGDFGDRARDVVRVEESGVCVREWRLIFVVLRMYKRYVLGLQLVPIDLPQNRERERDESE